MRLVPIPRLAAWSLVLPVLIAGCLGPPAADTPTPDTGTDVSPRQLFDDLRAQDPMGTLLAAATITLGAGEQPVTFESPSDAELVIRWDYDGTQPTGLYGESIRVMNPDGDLVVRLGLSYGQGLLPGMAGEWSLRPSTGMDNARGDMKIEVGLRHEALELPAVEDIGPTDAPAVVVAIVDTGINPYHLSYQRPYGEPGSLPVAAVDADAGAAARWIDLGAADDFKKSVQGDANAWMQMKNKTLYRFADTSLYSISFLGGWQPTPGLDYDGHGTAVAGSVLQANPEATIVSVQVTSGSLHDGILWAARQPWIDVITVSWSAIANVPLSWALYQAGYDEAYPSQSLEAAASGKLILFAAGNDPNAHITDSLSGPPWAIAVGGADETMRAESSYASKGADVVSNATVYVPAHRSLDGLRWIRGTSFASPTAAGELSEALLELRRAAGHTGSVRDGFLVNTATLQVSAGELRHAMNRSAVYWGPTEYNPTNAMDDPVGDAVNGNSEFRERMRGDPVPVVVPWLQMGWGYVGPGASERIVGLLLRGEEPEPKPVEAEAWMAAVQEARAQFWKP